VSHPCQLPQAVARDRGLLLSRDELRKLRRNQGWSQEELAGRAGVGVDAIVRAEGGRRISGDSAQCIAAALRVTVERLLAAAGVASSSRGSILSVPASNIPIRVPTHFMGRDDALTAIETALGHVAIAALHGLRGVGKTTLAAAYAERHRGDYRATWWIRAQLERTMRADLVALGVRLGWVGKDEQEPPALEMVMEHLRYEGESILLIFDNAIDADELTPYLPRGGAARVLITSNFHDFSGLAEQIEIPLWPEAVGAHYILTRTRREAERAVAEHLSDALGGLPLAHEQAATYCARLGIALTDYARRFADAPVRMLDTEKDAPREYHNKLTVAKTFSLAIDEATKLHPAAEQLIVYAALLAPEPIPLFLFAEVREKFSEPLTSALANDGLDEAVAALLAFALVDRQTIADERDAAITTDTIRLHRLVREVAAERASQARESMRCTLLEAVAALYPKDVFDAPKTWPRARRLDQHGSALVRSNPDLTNFTAEAASQLLDRLASYRHSALAAYESARSLFERALAIREKAFGTDHPLTASSLNNLARLIWDQGDLTASRGLFERALAIREKVLGPEDRRTASSLNNLASLLQSQGDLSRARPLFERALTIRENVCGPDHPLTASSLNNLARLLRDQGVFAEAQPLCERALAIREMVLGPEDPRTAASLNNLGRILQGRQSLTAARGLFERAVGICEKVLGPEHPYTAVGLNNLSTLLRAQGDIAGAQSLCERALAIREKVLGPNHPNTAASLQNLANLLRDQR
jgi:tetratricopeptide (TPR) repeat protein/transcriptional regulator with XRE-family HTH domain